MREKGSLVQQLTIAAPWLLVAAIFLALGLLTDIGGLVLAVGMALALGLNALLHWWQASDARRARVLESMLSSSPVIAWSIDRNGLITSFRGAAPILGRLREQDALGRNVADCFADNPAFLDDLHRVLDGERVTVSREMGGRYYRHHLRPWLRRGRRVDGVHCISVDLTREQRLISRVELAQKIFEHTGDAVVVADSTRRILMVNPAFSEITLFGADDVVGLKLGPPPMHNQRLSFYREIWETLRAGKSWRGEISARRKNGEAFAVRMTLVPVRTRAGEVTHYLAFMADVTAFRENQDELRYLANHDALTGLPNRRLFLDRLDQAIRRARRSGERLAIYFMDLDRFKEVNDSHGHQAGDLILKEVAGRLQEIVRQSDTVARLAGDEFTIIAEDVAGDDEVSKVASKILDCFSRPFALDGQELMSSTSIGIALFPDDGSDSLALLKSADVAMYRAKEGGRNRYYLLSQHRYLDDFHELQATRTDLGEALVREQLALVYQPIVAMGTGEVIGCEVLLRWNHGRHGLLTAGNFIGLAEEAGLMSQFGDWVLRTACLQVRTWQELGYAMQVLSVNLAADQVQDLDLPERVLTILRETGLDPSCLVLEVAEGVVLEHLGKTADLVAALSLRGVRFSIDDFGTGTSAYSYLKSLPVHLLKIDHRILNEVRHAASNEGFVRAMVSLADLMGMEIIAEGVEREPQERFLRELGCSLGQGYLYGHPVAAEEFLGLLRHVAVPATAEPCALPTRH